MNCSPCEYSAEHGWWGETLPNSTATHCRECRYPGTQVWGHCMTCHDTFRGIGTFDRHKELKECPPDDDLNPKWVLAGRPVQLLSHPWGFTYYGTRDG